MHKRICTIGFLALSFVSGSVAAATPSNRPASAASIDELLQVMQVHKLLDLVTAQVVAQEDGRFRRAAMQMTNGRSPDAGEQGIIDAQAAKMDGLLKQQMSWDSMQPIYVDLYSKHFTQREIDDALAFYRSPSGQAMVTKMPAVMAQATQLRQARMASYAPQSQKIFQDTKAQITAYEASKQKAATGNAAGKGQ
ncbi:DUF2059 domain-containing protein [Rhodanobacter sp. DHB23]|uniref:DUF2059 domain-containing protein n=1 Tax=Rhodanobacter sp. DHB23 TaxID=2775923 RepID=UPI00177CCBC2|nr:DUF2059 domain-containing protein [Rhodanobacter sp. DHB23]MBD8874471.1 DUF2059 domain-containing protein [Rhodanobacter sp. DHB23]